MSLRSPALMLLPFAMLAGGCDRQGAAPAQPPASAAASESGAAAANADPAAGEAFTGKLDTSAKGAAMPDLTFADPAGQKLRLADLKGKPVLINLWATWCGPCVIEMPTIEALAAKYDGKLTVLAVSQDLGQKDKISALFVQKKFVRLHPWLDPDNALSSHYNTGVLPTTVLYDKDGKEVWRMVGGHDWSSAQTDELVKAVVGG
ncbi:TlpA family protein disulfide reductase [Novosphingobium sp.]|uniref:TlpA family protein disulfide reductase n=1 Tax=Novosphingobium sp. TaxID=1874826 RepID=UPI0038B7F9D1